MDARLEKLLITICEAGDNVDKASDDFREYVESFGLDHFILACGAARLDGAYKEVKFIDTLAGDFQEEYEFNDYLGADLVAAASQSLTSDRPSSIVSYGTHLSVDQSLPEDVRRFYGRISDFGMETGVAWVSLESDEEAGYKYGHAINLGSSRENDELVETVMNENSGLLIAGASILRMLRPEVEASLQEQQKPRLSGREIDVLIQYCAGFRVDRISEQLDLSASTVRFHGNNVKKKLNAKTMTEAVATAFRYGLL